MCISNKINIIQEDVCDQGFLYTQEIQEEHQMIKLFCKGWLLNGILQLLQSQTIEYVIEHCAKLLHYGVLLCS